MNFWASISHAVNCHLSSPLSTFCVLRWALIKKQLVTTYSNLDVEAGWKSLIVFVIGFFLTLYPRLMLKQTVPVWFLNAIFSSVFIVLRPWSCFQYVSTCLLRALLSNTNNIQQHYIEHPITSSGFASNLFESCSYSSILRCKSIGCAASSPASRMLPARRSSSCKRCSPWHPLDCSPFEGSCCSCGKQELKNGLNGWLFFSLSVLPCLVSLTFCTRFALSAEIFKDRKVLLPLSWDQLQSFLQDQKDPG